jgi:hypothetical protein
MIKYVVGVPKSQQLPELVDRNGFEYRINVLWFVMGTNRWRVLDKRRCGSWRGLPLNIISAPR